MTDGWSSLDAPDEVRDTSSRQLPTAPAGRLHTLWAVLTALLLLAATTACGSVPEAQGAPSSSNTGEVVVIIASGTSDEPQPELVGKGFEAVQAAAESTNVTDGPGGTGSVALVSGADEAAPLMRVELTPRRANGAVEHGSARDGLINTNVTHASDAVRGVSSSTPGLDLLESSDRAVAGIETGTLVIISNGLSTSGGFDLREVRWNADPDQVARELQTRGLLPELEGWDVIWLGLNAVAGDQPPLPKPVREANRAYWEAICVTSQAASCTFDETRFISTEPASSVDTPNVEIPAVESVVGPSGETTTTLPDALLGFGPNSAVLAPSATELIASLAEEIKDDLGESPDAQVTVTGFTADPPGSTPAARSELALQRAQSVREALRAAGVTNNIVALAGEVDAEETAVVDGEFVEVLADPMRRVEVRH